MRNTGPIAYIILYATMYAAFGVASPFWPKFFETRALTSQQIGVILAAAMLVILAAAMLMRLVAGPLVGMLADLLGSLRLVLAICAALAAGTAAILLRADTFWLLLLTALVQAAALAPITSIADALSVNAAKPQLAGKPFEYGWIRGSASAAFVLGTLIVGQLRRVLINPECAGLGDVRITLGSRHPGWPSARLLCAINRHQLGRASRQNAFGTAVRSVVRCALDCAPWCNSRQTGSDAGCRR